MSRHAGPPGPPETPPVPEPSYAERARTLVHLGRTGALATLSRRHPGHPFASVMPYAVDGGGQPLFLISTMAMHTQNLAADGRASLLVTELSPAAGDPLATGRVTLIGAVEPVSRDDAGAVRGVYLERHPNAAYWVDFEDFAFHRLAVRDVYYVGGFAAMDWVDAEAYRAARPDPLADAAAGIIEHMNRDHGESLRLLARVLARVDADEATMVSVDRLGFKLRVRSETRLASTRIAFPREVRTPAETRAVLIEMVTDARARTPA